MQMSEIIFKILLYKLYIWLQRRRGGVSRVFPPGLYASVGL